MKHYILWLIGGASIEGDTDPKTAEYLLLNCSGEHHNFVFADTDGQMLVELSQVVACSISDADNGKQITGFVSSNMNLDGKVISQAITKAGKEELI